MRNFYVVGNSEKTEAGYVAEIIQEIVKKNNGICHIGSGYVNRHSIPENIECIITLGGDGTLLKAAGETASLGIPLIGVNLGHLGFLTSVSYDNDINDIKDMLKKLFECNFTIEDRMMLEGIKSEKYTSEVGASKKFTALNEVVIKKTETVKFTRCKVYVDGEFLNEYSADGIIIATPTGSTAYNLSAGGPIAGTAGRMIIITPICPHALSRRSIVLSPESIVEVEMIDREDVVKAALFDGEVKLSLNYAERIYIRESSVKTRLVKLKGASFLDNLRRKMNNSI
ncbi:hypothetical protein HMPREF9333_00384 [Johnsonella ignava ATCC 51276]|jgi:probable inorganic polyphosphate/ATP-NAD kinase|uniref:NAD kinase n=1 Tax=Johnsonella ignava ATCC 51276 TaxID=679200 RepID=G5GFP5_9FIRM|nr:NAD(+)/NADH kinase [Johnsonella ignava]EHI56522.1 hypothetical protein HMPREF9333_00384 [Johnsonella ignava ATCC 51276]